MPAKLLYRGVEHHRWLRESVNGTVLKDAEGVYHALVQKTSIDNRYTLVELLGSGGMAQVYIAHDEVLDRDVALKILREQYADDEEFVERFRREARSAAGLSHPNIVSVYDQGRSEDGAYYMAMEYVPGGTLKDRIWRDGALAPDVAAGVALQIADALQAAHERGVIHRDIKPQNVLVTGSGGIKVADFGIARAASATRVTRTDHILGTAGYMSPEQAKGELVGPGSDLYSLGVVLYEMLIGNLPYEADSALAQTMKHINELPPSPREANPEVPEALNAVTMKLLAKNPERRYPSAAALISDLERARSALPLARAEETEKMTTSRSPSPKTRTRRMTAKPPVTAPMKAPGGGKRHRGRLFLLALATLFGVALLGGLAWALTSFRPVEPSGSGSKPAVEEATIPEAADPVPSQAEQTFFSEAAPKGGQQSNPPSQIAATGPAAGQNPTAGPEIKPDTPAAVVSTEPEQVTAQNPAQAEPTPQPTQQTQPVQTPPPVTRQAVQVTPAQIFDGNSNFDNNSSNGGKKKKEQKGGD